MTEKQTLIIGLVFLMVLLAISVMCLISQLKDNSDLTEANKKLVQSNTGLDYKTYSQSKEIISLEKEIEFQKQLNKTLSEGLEAFTKKSKK